MTLTTRYLLSPSHLAANIQRPVSSVFKAAEELGIEPALVLNGVAHFDNEQAETIARHLTSAPTSLRNRKRPNRKPN